MRDNNSNPTQRATDLIPFARQQWQQAAAHASRASESQDLRIHREALEIGELCIARLRRLLEAAGLNG